MKKRIKKRFWFLIIFLFSTLAAGAVVTAVCAGEYTDNVYFCIEAEETGYHYTTQNGNVELKNVFKEDNVLKATFVPKSIGYDVVYFYTETDEPAFDGDVELKFWSGPFDTIFCFNPLIDFEGSIYVIVLFLILTTVFGVLLLYSFVDLVFAAEYGYAMVACYGAGLFCLQNLAANINTVIASFVNQFSFGFGNYIYEFTKAGGSFTKSMTALMAVFCLFLIISNLSLIRHEGFRIHNLLGVVLGVVWVSGFIVYQYLENKSFDDISKIYSVLSNGISAVISYFICMLFATVISAFMASRSRPPLNRDYIVILGCAINRDGSLTPILKGRVDAAIGFAEEQLKKTGKQAKFVPSGGQGSDEVISEGEAMKRYLVEQGIDERYILPETKSVNTYENIKLSKAVIDNDARGGYKPAFATTNYHVFRGYTLSKKLELKNVRGISSKTKWYFFPNAFLREFAGFIAGEWKLHLAVIIFIITVFTLTFIYLV